jgi:hypothetical protein
MRLLDDVPAGWIGRAATAERDAPVLFDAAMAREIDPARDAVARTVLGRLVE